jgi:uncharacterized protein YjiS (DUF1127 family)
MPPRQTSLTPETGRDAARLGLDLSIAAPDDALSETDGAGPTAASTRNVLSLLKRYWRAFQERRQRRSLRAALHDLSDRELKDIGVRRDEIDYTAPHRAIDTLGDSTTYLWITSRGVM